ncbi:MAG: hypothetical protein IPJ76_16715 [Flavobacteriales bacterium]|nr:MAG: hypothetical protein IPJ76_16715 [Flavobacteriales bacterium]
MTKKEKLLAWVLVGLVVLTAVLGALAPKPVDWSDSFSRFHDKPFGGQLVFGRLGDLFDEVEPVQETIYETFIDREPAYYEEWQPAAQLYITHRFQPHGVDLEYLLDMAARGDHVFIAANDPGTELMDTLGLAGERRWQGWSDTLELHFVRGDAVGGTFSLARLGSPFVFTDLDSSRTTVVCRNAQGGATMVHVRHGLGHFYLCTTPRAFTNYHLLKDDNNDFIEAALGWIPAEKVLWDEFYKVGREGSLSPVQYVLDQPALKWAYRLAFALLIVYVFIRAKREQRAIPVVAPLKNASRDFVGTLGRLYYEKGDHADLARKMLAHFKEDVRQRAYLRQFAYDERTANHLARRTGLPIVELGAQLKYFESIENNPNINEGQLLALSDRLHSLRQRL